MCMKYLNINVQCFDSRSTLLGGMNFSSLIESVDAEDFDGKFSVGDFNIVTFINVRGTRDKKNPDNPVDMQKTLDFRIRLTKLDKDEEKLLSYDIKDFSIDLSDETIIHRACFEYAERIEITKIDKIVLNDKGPYVIKIMVKERDEQLYNIQTVHPLFVK